MDTGTKDEGLDPTARDSSKGIMITRPGEATPQEPRIWAFIWGGKVRPAPTLPYGRREGAA